MEELHRWFLANKRAFPWREMRTPYRVWISEVMLQQTRASVVVPYFERWMEQFPNIETLAKAPQEQVIKAWEGLGYYSRARNLHRGAQEVVAKFQGALPSTAEELSQIAGLGPYTVGALLSFGFQKLAAAVDGNVARVVSRYFAIEEVVDRPKTKQVMEKKVVQLLDQARPWITMEALIELGALICKTTPLCAQCPIRSSCAGFARGIAQQLPLKRERAPITLLNRFVTVVEAQGRFLVGKEENGKVMADLYQFPYFESDISKIKEALFQKFQCRVKLKRRLKPVMHTFTRYRAHLIPLLFTAEAPRSISGWIWADKEELARLPFSAGHRAILHEILR